jgi:hypothetical protein
MVKTEKEKTTRIKNKQIIDDNSSIEDIRNIDLTVTSLGIENENEDANAKTTLPSNLI